MPPPRNACAPQPSRAGNGTTKQNFSHCQQYYGSFVFPPITFVSAQGEMEGRSRDLLQRHSLRRGSERQEEEKKSYDISNVWQSSGREVNSSIKEGREKG